MIPATRSPINLRSDLAERMRFDEIRYGQVWEDHRGLERGLAVTPDDAVHFLYHWRAAERRGGDWPTALRHTFAQAGKPAVVTSLLLLVGYPVLMLGEVRTIFSFGLPTTVAAAAALFGDLVLLALLVRRFPPRRGARVSALN